MKTTSNYLRTKKIALLISLPILFTSCEFFEEIFGNGCNILQLADLIIPKIVQHYDNQGNPLYTSSNELYYNERTGEYFNQDSPPINTLQVGDYIQMATRVYNTVANDHCKLGATAPQSTTAPVLTINSPTYNGVFSIPNMITEPIPVNSNTLTATRFQLITPGNYRVNFNANAPRNIREHSYDNNYYYGENGNYSKTNPFSFNVVEGKNKIKIESEKLKIKQSLDAPKSIEEIKNLTIFKFINSKDYDTWTKQSVEK